MMHLPQWGLWLLSHVTEVCIEKLSTPVNEELRVVMSQGRYLLNSKDLNYSYGSLQKAFEKEFYACGFSHRKFTHVLLLGLGGGCLIQSLRTKFKIDCPIVAVEKDPVVINLAYKYFHLNQYPGVKIVCQDAVEFLSNNSETFDLILVDIYVGNDVPPCCETPEFISNLKKSLQYKGLLIFNKYVYDEPSRQSAIQLIKNFKKAFPALQISALNKYMIICEG